jgi:hypothetical protein
MLRNNANAGRNDLCRIESEHLHSVPTLVGEPNKERHGLYILLTRVRYLQSHREIGATEYLEEATIWYSEPWSVLASIAKVPLLK